MTLENTLYLILMYFYAKNPSKIFGGGFDLDLAEQFLIPTMFTEEQNKLLLSCAELSWILNYAYV